MGFGLKQIVGAALFDLLPFEWRLRTSWLHIRNRKERLQTSPDGRGVACQWQWTSDLNVQKVFPTLGVHLIKRCTKDWPIRFSRVPQERRGDIEVSFIIGHRGQQRLPMLISTLATVAAQRGVTHECIVVEQSGRSEIQEFLPAWVRHIHTPLPHPDMPYCRSWALNVGARAARGGVLVFHDNDMLIPEAYAAEVVARCREGYEAINLKRFIFYLGGAHSSAICAGDRRLAAVPAESVVQNLEAGGSVAMVRDAFFAIGGYDERFVGWGGEDNEFWERARTRKVWPFGYLPIVHLWHAPQPQKTELNRLTASQFWELSSIPPERRIAVLTQRRYGDGQKMDPQWSAAKAQV